MAEQLWNNGEEYPIGTRAEIDELGFEPNRTGSCSAPTKTNRGCAWFFECRFRQFRDHVNGKRGPLNCGVFTRLAPAEGSHQRVREVSCYDYYYGGYAKRAEQGRRTGEIILVVAVEGDGKKVKFLHSEAKHPVRDPLCHACSRGQCNEMKDIEEVRPIRPFPRPAQVYKNRIVGTDLMDQMVDEQEREQVLGMLPPGILIEDEPEPAKEAGVAKK